MVPVGLSRRTSSAYGMNEDGKYEIIPVVGGWYISGMGFATFESVGMARVAASRCWRGYRNNDSEREAYRAKDGDG